MFNWNNCLKCDCHQCRMQSQIGTVMHRVMENLQESNGYGRWFLGFSDGMHYPLPGTVEDAMQEYEIPEDDQDWINGFNEGQAEIDWDKVMNTTNNKLNMAIYVTKEDWEECRKYIQNHRGIRKDMKIKILREIWKGVEIDNKVVWNEDEGTAGVWDEEGLFIPVLVKCADCNLITTASIEEEETRMEGHNGIWAHCPECDITGYEKIILVYNENQFVVNDYLTPLDN